MKTRRRIVWLTMAAAVMAEWRAKGTRRGISRSLLALAMLTASTGLAGAQVVDERDSDSAELQPREPRFAVDESRSVTYRDRNGVSVRMKGTDLVLVNGKTGFKLAPSELDDRGNVAVQAVRAGGEYPIPVYATDTGALQAPVGGVLLMLDETWGPAEVERFLADHELGESFTPLESRKNGYLVHTVPGSFAIEYSNQLSGLSGVEYAVPNLWVEVTGK